MQLQKFENFYFIGIGGIGMSALAQYFFQTGKNVAGYDKTESEVTQMLQKKGIDIHFSDDVSLIDNRFKNPEKTLVIYTPAIKKLNELDFFLNNDFQIVKRSKVLGLITENNFCIAVAGTHGKTTTSSIIAHILYEMKASASAFLGGICQTFQSNLMLNGTDFIVVEADEFDRSFLQLSPNVACITSTDADHLDIYENEAEFLHGFELFTQKIKPNGKLIVRKNSHFQGITFGIEDNSDYEIRNISVENGSYHFSIFYSENSQRKEVKNIRFSQAGHHNLLNALAGVALLHQSGFSVEETTQFLETFQGVKRRFSYQIKTDNQIFIDDYAHHPSELNALHQAVTQMHPNKEITLIFQPHLFSRTRDFGDDFAKSLEKFHRVVLLEIYPARELPIEGITSQWLFEKINSPQKFLLKKENLLDWIGKNPSEVLVTAGAGDIGQEVEKIKTFLL